MTDYFALLNQPRRPWLDPEAIKQEFLARSASVHPDRAHHLTVAERDAAQKQYVELNAAYSCLKDPRERLRALLQMERGTSPKGIQHTPSTLVDLSMEVGKVCREADGIVQEQRGVTSPLLKVKWFGRNQAQLDKLRQLQNQIGAQREGALGELKEIDSRWSPGPHSDSTDHDAQLVQLEEIYRLFSYFDRWLQQIQERMVELSV
jgi:curved DNA-binding protein CbpA